MNEKVGVDTGTVFIKYRYHFPVIPSVSIGTFNSSSEVVCFWGRPNIFRSATILLSSTQCAVSALSSNSAKPGINFRSVGFLRLE